MTMKKPYAAACDNNKQPILDVIQPLLTNCKHVLEVGSGTGQHAVYFAEQMPHLMWQTSDVKAHHAGMQQWINDSKLDNVLSPLELDVRNASWDKLKADAVYSSNTVHMMTLNAVGAFFHGVGQCLSKGGLFMLYGPFNYDGMYTSESNLQFDQWLKSLNSQFGIRDFELLDKLASASGLELKQDFEMPANNRILCWQKR